MRNVSVYLLLSLSMLSLKCSEKQTEEYMPEIELLEYNSSTGSSIINYFFLIKNYDKEYFNQIVFQKYVIQLYDSLKYEIPERRFFGGVVFVKSKRYLDVKDFDKVSYQDYKKDIIIEFRFDIKEQIKNERLLLNSVGFYENGQEFNVETFLFDCQPQSEVIEKLPQKRW